MGNSNNDVQYDDVYAGVLSLLDSDVPLDKISLRMIRTEMGERGSLQTISRHFGPIKERLERGEAIDTVELTETDMDALRTLVGEIVERRTILARLEKKDSAQAMSDVIRGRESDLAMSAEIIHDLEHQVEALEGEAGALQLVNRDLEAQVVRLEGMVDALNATIATLAPSLVQPVATHDDAKEEERPAIETDRHQDDQVEMPLDASGADSASDADGVSQG